MRKSFILVTLGGLASCASADEQHVAQLESRVARIEAQLDGLIHRVQSMTDASASPVPIIGSSDWHVLSVGRLEAVQIGPPFTNVVIQPGSTLVRVGAAFKVEPRVDGDER
jgi:hypothetical protein